jgi:pilus assembly protein CpaF
MSLLKRLQQGDGSPQQPVATIPGGDSNSKPPTLQSRRVAAPTNIPQQDTYQDLKTRVQNKLLAGLDPTMDVTKTGDVRKTIQELFEQILSEENIVLSRPERARLFEQIAAEILGFGPLQTMLEDETITEIMVNGAKNI